MRLTREPCPGAKTATARKGSQITTWKRTQLCRIPRSFSTRPRKASKRALFLILLKRLKASSPTKLCKNPKWPSCASIVVLSWIWIILNHRELKPRNNNKKAWVKPWKGQNISHCATRILQYKSHFRLRKISQELYRLANQFCTQESQRYLELLSQEPDQGLRTVQPKCALEEQWQCLTQLHLMEVNWVGVLPRKVELNNLLYAQLSLVNSQNL